MNTTPIQPNNGPISHQSYDWVESIAGQMGLTINSRSESSITLASREALSPSEQQTRYIDLTGRLKGLGYDKFKVCFSGKDNFELVDGFSFEEGLAQWQRQEGGEGSAEAVLRIKDAFYNNSTELNLAGLSLKSLPPQIGYLTQLTELSLNGNKQIKVPEAIGRLSNLTHLGLSGIELTSVPDVIRSLTNLTFLNLSMNELTGLSDAIRSLTKLTRLILQFNDLSSLPEWIGELSNLTMLILAQNKITSLPYGIGKLSNLKTLYLNYNMLTSVSPQIGRLSNLQEFLINGNLDLKELPLALGQCQNLKNLTDLNINQTSIRLGRWLRLLDMCCAQSADAKVQIRPRLEAWQAFSCPEEMAWKEEFDLNFIMRFEPNEVQTINEWLSRLELTKDFNTSSQQARAKTACGMLQSLMDTSFKESFFTQISSILEDWDDKAAKSFNELIPRLEINDAGSQDVEMR